MLPPACFLLERTAPLSAVPAADLVALHQEDLPHHPLLLLRAEVDEAAAMKVSAVLLACPQDLAPQDKGRVIRVKLDAVERALNTRFTSIPIPPEDIEEAMKYVH